MHTCVSMITQIFFVRFTSCRYFVNQKTISQRANGRVYALRATSNFATFCSERRSENETKRTRVEKNETNNSHSCFKSNHIRSSLTFDHTNEQHTHIRACNEIRSCFINVQFIAFAWRFRKAKKEFFIRVIIRNLLLSTFFRFTVCFFFLHLFVRSLVHSRESLVGPAAAVVNDILRHFSTVLFWYSCFVNVHCVSNNWTSCRLRTIIDTLA